jgi:hypothetical protein
MGEDQGVAGLEGGNVVFVIVLSDEEVRKESAQNNFIDEHC